jgi:RNA polymerase sigma-70 factor (ECF subfamily)
MLASTLTSANAKPRRRLPEHLAALHDGLAKLAPELHGRALKLARRADVAEDLVQDTIERAIRFQDHFQHGTNLRAWVYQILYSVFITRCRRGRRERNALELLSTDPCAWTIPEQKAEMERLSPPVQRALDGLPKGFRRAVVLVDIEEMSYKAAAKRMRVPVGTVMSRLHRGRKLLAEGLRANDVLPLAA